MPRHTPGKGLVHVPRPEPMLGPPRPAPRAPVDRGPDVITGQSDSTRPRGRFGKEMLNRKNLKRGALVAAGVLAAGSVVQSRRREGSPPGRQSMYRN